MCFSYDDKKHLCCEKGQLFKNQCCDWLVTLLYLVFIFSSHDIKLWASFEGFVEIVQFHAIKNRLQASCFNTHTTSQTAISLFHKTRSIRLTISPEWLSTQDVYCSTTTTVCQIFWRHVLGVIPTRLLSLTCLLILTDAGLPVVVQTETPTAETLKGTCAVLACVIAAAIGSQTLIYI